MASKKNKSNFIKKLVIVSAILLIVIAAYKVYKIYNGINQPNVNLINKTNDYIFIPTGSNYYDVTNILYSNGIIINRNTFEWVAGQKGYRDKVKAGRFKIKHGMSNNELVNLLRSGKQDPVRLVFNKVRTKERFAGVIGRQIEADSVELLKLLYDAAFLSGYGLNKDNALCMFIPNTYHVFWNTNAHQFIDRMFTESKNFWDNKRLQKANTINLTKEQVIILASIVEEETTKNDEKADIAGVYINRLKKGMRLQADPTVKFAIGNFEIKRILTKHLDYDSPYNTYKYAGLPPGPICLPSVTTIDAVLNYKKHKYLYFCANDDFSGYHSFAATLVEHNKNAEKYRKALNRNRIYR